MILKLFTLSATSGSRSVQFTMQIYASFNALRTTVTCRDARFILSDCFRTIWSRELEGPSGPQAYQSSGTSKSMFLVQCGGGNRDPTQRKVNRGYFLVKGSVWCVWEMLGLEEKKKKMREVYPGPESFWMDKRLVDFGGTVQAALLFPGLCYLREGEEATSSLLSTTVSLLSASLWFAWLG